MKNIAFLEGRGVDASKNDWIRKFKEKGTPKLKYEPHDTGCAERQKLKPQISGFPQQELVSGTI